MNVDEITNECFQLLEEVKKSGELFNKLASDYNEKMMNLVTKLKETKDEDTFKNISHILVLKLQEINIDKITSPLNEDTDLIDIDFHKDKETEKVTQIPNDTSDEDYCNDEYDEYDDFSMGGGSSTRYLKGTGKMNHKEVYNTKHIRKIMGRK
jgi:hypothetical protein